VEAGGGSTSMYSELQRRGAFRRRGQLRGNEAVVACRGGGQQYCHACLGSTLRFHMLYVTQCGPAPVHAAMAACTHEELHARRH
jgi:hypothetical protein